jgi:hypothetical protein
VQGQNFHIRCRESILEYNWFARANSYEGDLMSDDDFSGAGPFVQTMTLRGNVIVQKANPNNNSQVIAMYNDAGLPDLTLNLRAVYNTFVGNGGNAAFVHVSNADTTQMSAELTDNILSGTGRPFLIEDMDTGTVTGRNNWLRTGATVGPLTGSVQSASPGFRNPTDKDYRLETNSVCRGAASAAAYGLPGREYWFNEVTNRRWRVREAASDLGAFESTGTASAFGPYDADPQPTLGILSVGGDVRLAWPLWAQDYQLVQSTLPPPLIWENSPYVWQTNATGCHVTFPAAADSHAFRLRR